MCTILHDKMQWKKQQQQNKSWQNETAKTGQFQKQSKQETNNKNKKIQGSLLVDVEVFRYLVKIGGHRSGNV